MERKRINLATPTMHGEEIGFVQEAFEKNWIAPAKEIFPFLHFEKADTDQLEEFLSEIKYTYQILLNLPEKYPDAEYCYKASW